MDEKKLKILISIFTLILIFFLFTYKDIYRSLSYEKRYLIKKLFLSDEQILLKPLNTNQLTLPNTYFTRIDLSKIKIPNSYNTLNSRNKAVGHIDHYKDWVFFISGTGKILKIKILNLLNKKNNFLKVKTNFNEIIKNNELLLSSSKKIKINHKVSVNDIMIVNDIFYISYTATKNDCYYNKIVSAVINVNDLIFGDLFDPNQCIKKEEEFSKFNAQAAGGRIIKKDNKIFLTTGTYLKNNLAQNDDSIFGKVLEIEPSIGTYHVYAKGFRNPQGLINYNNNLILTEHGPFGGDEINKLIKNKNYGWNISSYGRTYTAKYEDDASFFKDHNSFEEPIFAFIPSVGISQIIPAYDFEKKWKGDLIAATLNGRSIFRLSFDKSYERLISYERIFLGERIRDIIYLPKYKKFILVLEESGSIGILSNLNEKIN